MNRGLQKQKSSLTVTEDENLSGAWDLADIDPGINNKTMPGRLTFKFLTGTCLAYNAVWHKVPIKFADVQQDGGSHDAEIIVVVWAQQKG